MALGEAAFETRANHIGGSEVAIVLGLSKWATPAALLAAKMSGQKPEIPPERERIMKVGKAMEDVVIEFFKEANPGREFEMVAREPRYIIEGDQGGVIMTTHPDCAWREVDPTGQRSDVRLLEIKTTTGNRDDISYREIPVEYETQVQMEMHGARIAGSPVSMVDIVIYDLSNGKLHTHQAVYDRNFCEQAVKQCEAFLELMHSGRPVEELVKQIAGPTDNVNELLLIAAGDEVMEVGEDAEQLEDTLDMLERLNATAENYEVASKELTAAKNAVANAMGDHRTLEIMGDRVVSYGNTRGAARGGKVIREMQEAFTDPRTAREVAGVALGKLAAIPGITEGALIDAIEPAIALAAKKIAGAAIERNTGAMGRQFRPNRKKIAAVLEKFSRDREQAIGR